MVKKVWFIAFASFFVGILCFSALRFLLVHKNEVHYHANFAVFINGNREKFDNFTFYEEVASCDSSELNNPKHRAHLHDNVNGVVHVHEAAVTWGAMFANLGFTLGNKALVTDKVVFVDEVDGKKLQFVLNGKPVDTVENRVIQSEDALLITYGNDVQATVSQQYGQIAHTAAGYNAQKDPNACTGGKPLTVSERFKAIFNFTEK